jgi:enoyl-CoA hydratase
MGEVHLGHENEIAIITLENPGRLNAFTRSMRAEIVRLLREIAVDERLTGAVLTGDGDGFCAGQDFNESKTWTQETPWVEEFELLFRALLEFPKPLIAAVNGVAAGGGFQTALLCDYRVAHPDVRMGQTEVRWGLASVTGTWLLQRNVGAAKARELVLSGRLMAADELLRLGLVDSLVPREDVLPTALAVCRELAANPAHSVARTKAWLYDSVSAEISTLFHDASRLHRQGFASGASQAGAVAFLSRPGADAPDSPTAAADGTPDSPAAAPALDSRAGAGVQGSRGGEAG